MKRNTKRIAAFFLTVSLAVSGCGADDGNGAAGNGIESSENGVTTGNQGNPEAEEIGNQLYLQERRNVQLNQAEKGYQVFNRFYEVMDGMIYLFRVEAPAADTGGGTGRQRVCAQTYDIETQTVEQYILTPEITESEEYTIYSVGLTADGEVSLKLFDLKNEGNPYSLVKMDLQGNILATANFFPDEEAYPWNMDPYSEDRIYHLADGRTIRGSMNDTGEAGILSWFGDESGKAGQEIGRLEDGLPYAICSAEDGLLYCVLWDDLLRWDPKKNTKETLFQLRNNGVSMGTDYALFTSDGKKALLCSMSNDEIKLYVLSNQEPVKPEGKINVACVQDIGIDYLKRMASTYSTEPGAMPLKLEKKTGETEDYRNQIFAELAAGGGPDLMLLTMEDIMLLTEKGYLLDMSDMIPEDVKSQILPSVLELCTIDGKLTAFTPHVEFTSMITTDQIWEGDRWSLEEFIEVAESREDWVSLISDRTSDLSPMTLFFWLFFRDAEHPSILDLEQGVCHFDSEEFIQILELCQKYGDRGANLRELEREEENALLMDGKIAAKAVTIYDMIYFSQLMSGCGQGCHVVGFPSQSGRGTYVKAYSYVYMAVNANTEHKEEIRGFLNYLLEPEQQYDLGTGGVSVRRDVIRDNVYQSDDGLYRMRTSSDGRTAILDVKPDGNPWLEEFLDYVENSKPMPQMPEAVNTILFEELQNYFTGDRSIEETVDNLQRRVQLYLDEK